MDRYATLPRLYGHRLRIGMPGRLHLPLWRGGQREVSQPALHKCGACEPECPWQALFEEAAVPELFNDDIGLNYRMMDQPSEFIVQEHKPKEVPPPEQLEANRAKWELAS